MSDSKSSPPDGPALLLVAAKSLQSYVLGSDKLREMVGATQLIEDFCDRNFAQNFLRSAGVEGCQIVTSAAGQTTIRFDSIKDAELAAALWPWAAHCHAPGLETHVAVVPTGEEEGSYAESFDAVQKSLSESRNAGQILDLPAAPPPAMRAPRSGKVASARVTFGKETELVDAEAAAKCRRRAALNKDLNTGKVEMPMFDAFGFDPETVGSDLNALAQMPLFLRHFTDEEGNPRRHSARQASLAIIHADGNGLGQAFIDLGKGLKPATNQDAMHCVADFSEGFRQVGLAATEKARKRVEQDFLTPLPLLPVVLAGDDLTLITRGEIAIPFVEAWLEAFEEESALVLKDLKQKFPIVAAKVGADFFSAGAGILFFQRSHPVMDAYRWCEELASLAKKEAKARATAGTTPPSALAFRRLQGGDDAVGVETDTRRYSLSGMPYFTGRLASGHRGLSQLRELRSALSRMPSGARRQLLSEMRNHPAAAQAFFDRSISVHSSKATRGTDSQSRIEDALAGLHGKAEVWSSDTNAAGDAEKLPLWSAIPDAVQWAAIEPEFPPNP